MSDKKTPLDTIREAIEYGKGCAAIVETIMNAQGVPMENMQHCVEGFWRREKEALAALRSMEGSEPVADNWRCGKCHLDAPIRFRVFGLCHICASGITLSKRNETIARLTDAHPPAPAVVELSHVIKAGDATFDAWLEEVKGDGWPEPSLGFIVHKDKWINVTKPFRP